jgi:predicted transcriptional regulator
MPTIQQADIVERVTFRCEPQLKKELQKLAIDRDTTLEGICEEILAEYLERKAKKSAKDQPAA